MGTRTSGYNSSASFYETEEYNYIANKQLSTSNFSTAYSRGWTGKGSLITIADTGANVNHVDLDDNIKYTKDYTDTSISMNSNPRYTRSRYCWSRKKWHWYAWCGI